MHENSVRQINTGEVFDTSNEQAWTDCSRRGFLKTAATSAVALCSFPIAAMLSSCSDSTSANDAPTGITATLALDANPALSTVGGFIRRTFGNNNDGRDVLVVRLSESSYGAMDVLCPHAGCNVGNPSEGQVLCPCHFSTFGSSTSNFGSRISGPAPRGLRTFTTAVEGNILTITF